MDFDDLQLYKIINKNVMFLCLFHISRICLMRLQSSSRALGRALNEGPVLDGPEQELNLNVNFSSISLVILK